MGNCLSDSALFVDDEKNSTISTKSSFFFRNNSLSGSSKSNSDNGNRNNKNGFFRKNSNSNLSNLRKCTRISLDSENLEAQRVKPLSSLINLLWGNDFSSPVEYKLKSGNFKVLDVGCGTGDWIMELARKYPKSKFIGVDKKPYFPSTDLPENVEFYVVDILEGLPFANNTFDFVHQRFLCSYLSTKQWEEIVINELLRVTKPLGYLELMETDLTSYSQGPITKKLCDAFVASMHAKGFSPMIESTLTRILSSDPNVINLQINSKKIPLGYWSEIKNYDNCLELFKLYKKCSLEYTSATSEDFDKMIEIYLEEIEDYKTYSKTHRFFGTHDLGGDTLVGYWKEFPFEPDPLEPQNFRICISELNIDTSTHQGN
nr:10645_t:CDS:2 [Entrophospora candida]